jgi:hypothetical protein
LQPKFRQQMHQRLGHSFHFEKIKQMHRLGHSTNHGCSPLYF